MTTLWLNPAAGVAGDMVLATLIDLGADREIVLDQIEALELLGYSIVIGPTHRCELIATSVTVRHEESHHHRSWSTIDALLAERASIDDGLDPRVAAGARRTFRALADAEAQVHGIDVDEVHFHEVGAVDALVDIVGSWAALVDLGVDRVVSSAVGLGAGVTAMAHGDVPVPAPATLELLRGHPVRPVDIDAETATPTGAALLTTMVDEWGPHPAGTVIATGRGAGTMDPPGHANVIAATLVDDAPRPGSRTPLPGDRTVAVVIECNLDDVTPEVLGHVIDRTLAAGSSDSWVTAVTMKKSRPGHLLSVLCPPELVEPLAQIVASETGTLGYRLREVTKVELDRRVDTVTVDGHDVRIKVGPYGAKPEHDDVVAAALATGRSHRDVSAAALTAWRAIT